MAAAPAPGESAQGCETASLASGGAWERRTCEVSREGVGAGEVGGRDVNCHGQLRPFVNAWCVDATPLRGFSFTTKTASQRRPALRAPTNSSSWPNLSSRRLRSTARAVWRRSGASASLTCPRTSLCGEAHSGGDGARRTEAQLQCDARDRTASMSSTPGPATLNISRG